MNRARCIASAVVALAVVVVSPAQAARIPTADESAALNGLMAGVIAKCDLQHQTALPLVTDDGTWGRIVAICGDPRGGGAAFDVQGVWAHRSSATATDWAIVGPTESSRVPPCTGKDGLLTRVPETVVRELREECSGPGDGGYRPSPDLRFDVFRNATHEFDAIGPSITFSSASHINGRGFGSFSIDRTGPPLGAGYKPKLADLTRAFGKASRTRCAATWSKLALKATVCGSGIVTKLTLGAPWRLSPDSEDDTHARNAYVRAGDTIELAHYLDPQLAALAADQRFRLAKLRIGKADVTTTVVTRSGRITAFEVAIKQRR